MLSRPLVYLLAGLAWALSLVGPVRAEPKFAFENTPGQLPKEVVPQSYAIAITPDPKSLTFRGSETITVKVRKATRTITLNALNLQITNVRLDDQTDGTISIDPDRQTASFDFPQDIPAGIHKLALDFAGRANLQAEGLYYVRYQTNEGGKVMFGTQMEPTDARRMFPLWDEPVFRASFQLSVTLPQSMSAVSNMPVEREEPLGSGLKTVRFAPTPPMASYLVVLCAGEFESLKDTVDGIDISVVTTKGKKETGRYALEVLKQILPYYNDYFGVKYPLPKLDMIAVPGGFSGAMENWGGITYNEAILLFDPAHSTQQTREAIYGVVAHEVAHQWFGDLVTMAWWDNLWLNEGFASWMSAKATDHFNPDWQIWLRSSGSKNTAMLFDARRTTHPIQQPVTNPAEAASAFDEITYQKGQAVLRMFESYLGEDRFRAGIRAYMAAHQFANTTTADLWEALGQASGQPVSSIAAGWTEQPGFPLLSVEGNCHASRYNLTLNQSRFTINDPKAQPLLWQIPITYGQGLPADNQNYLLAAKTGALMSASCRLPLKFNLGDTGYYRVRYAPTLFKALKQRFTQLPAADRVNLLSDSWAAVQANQARASDYLALVNVAKGDSELAVWQQILGSLNEIDRLEIGRPGRIPFQGYARTLLEPVYRRVGWDAAPGEAGTTSLLRTSVLTALGRFKDESVIREAQRRFQVFLKAPDSLPPNLRPAVFNTVGRYADSGTYEALLTLGRKTTSTEEKRLYYGALAGALDPKLAQRTLALALSDELEPNLATNLVQTVAERGEQPELAWEFAQKHYQPLLEKLAFFRRYRYLPNLVANFSDAEFAQQLEDFARAHLPADAQAEVRKGVESVRASASIKQKQLTNIDRYACDQSKTPGQRTPQVCVGVE
ncbi:M1 family metallopeptidase [Gloeobacter kilaueensis]|uniref:Aminopeptidase n=1 Tax=Gloeobacter kilaueensis (strain ATCC BAA-2537 / CCAP 1431/1 / ULC 316 / JS1) TaxID=1183438 RepID=U5QLW4_GLOK1|nr:M1 family metallopeptidase [Gloeobacter kilaueensis]AGY58609.1 aminopeptidase N [Gloeobacter kilaueensis JS1]